MHTTIAQAIGKPSDFKICKICNVINWYENEVCHSCKGKKFDKREKEVINYLQEEYVFYVEGEGYDEEEVDNIQLDI